MTENPSATACRQSQFSGCMPCSNGFWRFRLDISPAVVWGLTLNTRNCCYPVD